MRIVFIHFWFSFCCVVQFLFDLEIIPMKWLILMNVMRRLTNDKNSDECQLSFSSFLNWWWYWFWIEMSTVNYSIEKNEIMWLSFRRICLTSFVDELISFWKENFCWTSENEHSLWFHSENCSNEKNEMKFILFFWKGNSLFCCWKVNENWLTFVWKMERIPSERRANNLCCFNWEFFNRTNLFTVLECGQKNKGKRKTQKERFLLFMTSVSFLLFFFFWTLF